MITHNKLLAVMSLILALTVSFLYGNPPEPTDLSWDFTTDDLSWESTSNPDSFQVWIYQDGDLEDTVHSIAGTTRSKDLNAVLSALGTDASYTAIVVAFDSEGSTQSALSEANIKGMASLGITAEIEYGSDPVNFIFNQSSGSSFTMDAFTYSSATTAYNYSTYYAADSLKISFPAAGQYQLTAEFHGSSTETTFSQALVSETVYVPLNPATSSSGMDSNGNPNDDTQNNVLTIVVNPGNNDFKKTYTLRFRRRANNPPANISNITRTSYAFTCVVNGSEGTPQTVNGDNLSSLQDLRWSVNSDTGTGYFDDNQLKPLSNGDVTVTATLVDDSSISATSGTYTLSGESNWDPHLGKLELRGKTGSLISINPLFSSDPSATGEYSCSIVDDYSTLKLTLLAPYESQIYIDGARVSSNGESILENRAYGSRQWSCQYHLYYQGGKRTGTQGLFAEYSA